MAVHLEGQNLQGGQYKKMFEKNYDHFCDIFYAPEHKVYYEDYQSHVTDPVPWNTCPYPSGPGEVTNYLLDGADNILPPYMPGNEKWKLVVRMLRDGKVLGGYDFYVIFRNMKTLIEG